MKKIKLFIILILVAVLTAGCWDMREINQRIFPYSVGVDKDGKGGKLKITISYPNLNSIGKNATQEDRIFIVSTSADSIFEGAKELSTRLPYPFYFKHLRVLVFGEELAKDGELVKGVLDGMARDFTINKKIRLVVAEGKAEDLLMFKPNAKRQEVIEGALLSMLSREKDVASYTVQTLTNFIKNTDLNNIALMPKAKTREEEIKMFGACIFKDYRYIGDLNEKENRVVALITGKHQQALIGIPFKDTTISYVVSGTKVQKQLIEERENLKLKINLQMEGKLQEYILREKNANNTDEFIKSIEKSIEKDFGDEVSKTIDKLQNEYKVDALRIGEYIQKFHPNIWEKIEKDWDEIFQDMEIECNLDVKIRRRGLILIS